MTGETTRKLRAVVLTAVVLGSLFATAFVGPASAEVGNLSVGNDVVQSDATITINGNLDNAGNDVTFLIQDPTDDDVATVTKGTGGGGSSFTVTVDLGAQTFNGGDGTLDEGKATIQASEGSTFDGSDDTAYVTIDDTAPNAEITNPPDGAENKTHPTIKGDASDENGVKDVELLIERSNGDYYTGGGWSGTETTVDADGTTDWSYDTSTNGPTADDTYDVTVRVTDKAGNTVEATYPYPGGDDSVSEISYTVDTTAPSLGGVTLTDATDGNGTVTDGETVEISATSVTDATSGLKSVTVNASTLGAGENVELTQDSGDDYSTTVTVDGPPIAEGDFDLPVTATDNFGNENEQTTGTLYLDTSVANVTSLSVDHDFAGIVTDDEKLWVNASGITDPRGNTVTDATVDIEFVGTDTTYEADVTDGVLNRSVDTTAISNTADTVETTVRIKQADSVDADTAAVELVHEAKDLDEGYQVQGTPMPAARTVTENIDLVTTWDPEKDGDAKWVGTSGETAGEGYYVHGLNSNARFGYVFETSVADGEQHQTRTLAEGYNLVGATEDLTTSDKPTATADLGAMITFNGSDTFDGNANVNVSLRDDTEPIENDDTSINEDAFDATDDPNNVEIDGYEAYFVYIEDEEVTRIVDRFGYDPADR